MVARTDDFDLTRRDALRKLGIGVVAFGVGPAAFAACGDDSSSGGGAADGGVKGSTIDFIWWQGYDLPDQMGEWKKANDVKVRSTYIAAAQDIQAKIASGGGGLDLTGYTHAGRDRALDTKAASPMDESKIPNLKNLAAPFLTGSASSWWKTAEGERVGVPYYWGAIGINYDESTTEAPTSWSDLLDPKYKGRVGAIRDPITTLACACQALKLDASKLTPEDTEKVKEFLSSLLKQVKTVSAGWADMASLFKSGDIDVGFAGWQGTQALAAKAGKSSVRTALPREGGVTFIIGWAIPTDSDSREATLAFINESLKPEIAAAAASANVNATTIEPAIPLVTKANRDVFDYDDTEALFATNPPTPFPPNESDEYLTYEDAVSMYQELINSV